MDSPELQDHCYKPSGVPVTPQARRLGYEFPVYVSDPVFSEACRWNGISRFETSVDRRIYELIQYAYEGMLKKLSQQDDFLYYPFKCWFWDRDANAETKKKRRRRFGARLFVQEDGTPWMYIFDPRTDRIEALEKGDLSDEMEQVNGAGVAGEPDSAGGHVHDSVDTAGEPG